MDYNKIEKELSKPPKKNVFFNYLTSGYTGGYENEGVRKSLLINLFTHIASLAVISFCVKAFIDGNNFYGFILLTFFLFVLGIILFLRFTKNYVISSYLMSVVMYLLCTIFVVNGGEHSTAILWNYTFPIVAFFSLGRKKGTYFVTFTFLTFVILLFYEPIHIAEYSKAFKVRFSASYAVVNLLLYVFEYIREKTYLSLVESNEKKTYYLNQVIQQKEEIEAQSDLIEEANKELEKLSIVARETINSIIVFDAKGKPEWVNEGYTRLLGYTLDELIQKKGDSILNMTKDEKILSIIKDCYENGIAGTYSIQLEGKENKKLWIQTTITPVLDENGIVSRIVAIDTDISKLKESEEEIQQQKEELESQSELLMITNKELERKNTLITDSINYAKKIQQAIIPSINIFKQNFADAFVFFQPRDIVSGDFYWITEKGGLIITVVADCTGHGVPGAFMSIIGISLLNQIIKEKGITQPNEILLQLDDGLNTILNNSGSNNYEDGMDITISVFDKNINKIQVASSMQSVYLILDKQITIINGDLTSIGEKIREIKKEFKLHEFNYNKEAIVYMFSDGYQDQFGGENNKKFTENGIKSMLFEIHEMPMDEQLDFIKQNLYNWKGIKKQTDDILLVGLKIES